MYGGNETLKARGALSIAVPGEIAGLYEAWRRHGKLPWKRLVLPAARLARAFRVSPYLRMQMEATRDGILAHEGIRAVYAPGGDLLKAGEVCRNVRLARTLRAVAEQGPGVFYSGKVGKRLVKDVREVGGILTAEDLKRYRVKVRRPLTANVMGLQVITMPPPSAGGAGMLLVSRPLRSEQCYHLYLVMFQVLTLPVHLCKKKKDSEHPCSVRDSFWFCWLPRNSSPRRVLETLHGGEDEPWRPGLCEC
jgi:gamma-glutamyltranspeptidase/glutathione hydrolase/leukotriene-C4 hydrolase